MIRVEASDFQADCWSDVRKRLEALQGPGFSGHQDAYYLAPRDLRLQIQGRQGSPIARGAYGKGCLFRWDGKIVKRANRKIVGFWYYEFGPERSPLLLHPKHLFDLEKVYQVQQAVTARRVHLEGHIRTLCEELLPPGQTRRVWTFADPNRRASCCSRVEFKLRCEAPSDGVRSFSTEATRLKDEDISDLEKLSRSIESLTLSPPQRLHLLTKKRDDLWRVYWAMQWLSDYFIGSFLPHFHMTRFGVPATDGSRIARIHVGGNIHYLLPPVFRESGGGSQRLFTERETERGRGPSWIDLYWEGGPRS